MVPIDKIGDLLEAEAEAKKAPPASPEPPKPDGEDKPNDPPAEPEAKAFDGEVASALLFQLIQKKAA
jgi:hypothetical protein